MSKYFNLFQRVDRRQISCNPRRRREASWPWGERRSSQRPWCRPRASSSTSCSSAWRAWWRSSAPTWWRPEWTRSIRSSRRQKIRQPKTRLKIKKVNFSPTGNWTPVSRVTGGDTDHYTIEDWCYLKLFHIIILNFNLSTVAVVLRFFLVLIPVT